MKHLLLLLLAALPLFAATDTLTIYEVDGVSQTGRPIVFGRAFAVGDWPSSGCPQVVINAVPITTQVDVKTRYSDGGTSIQFATIGFIAPVFNANGTLTVFFQNTGAPCVNTGFLTQAQMQSFATWQAQILVTANGTTRTADALTMLGQTDPAAGTECKNRYVSQGSVYTRVYLQDCASTTTNDFGWSWNGTTMSSPVTGNASTASLHPAFVLTFYPSKNIVEVEYILENDWVGRLQDQQYSLVLKAGSGLGTVYTKALFTHIANTRWRKKFTSGTALGHIRVDHNFTYLKSTQALPNYDSGVTIDPSSDYTAFQTTDKGEIMGSAQAGYTGGPPFGWGGVKDFSLNNEFAPVQREDLEYLYNMGVDCGTVNGKCAKAWDILTGEVDANGSNTLVGVSGGGGIWNVWGSVPTHYRESRTVAGSFYCAGRASKDAIGTDACGSGTGTPAGKPFSRYYDTAGQVSSGAVNTVAAVGTHTQNGWSIPDCSHWLDYAYVAYLLTGDVFFQDEEYMGASFCLITMPSNFGVGESGKFFAFINPSNTQTRWFASVLSVGRAAWMAPASSVEKTFYTSMMNSNLEVMEGFQQVTGTTLTPSATNPACGVAFVYTAANRWDWGRCLQQAFCFNNNANCAVPNQHALHMFTSGLCPTTSNTYVQTALTSSVEGIYNYGFISLAMSGLVELGFTQAQSLATSAQKRYVEQVNNGLLDANGNPYLVSIYNSPVHAAGASTCVAAGQGSQNGNPILSTWAAWRNAIASSLQNVATFQSSGGLGNFPCDPGGHEYSLVARGAGTYASNVNSTDQVCTGGPCLGATMWSWLNSNVPYFSSGCGSGTNQIKFALQPRVVTPSTGYSMTISGKTVIVNIRVQ